MANVGNRKITTTQPEVFKVTAPRAVTPDTFARFTNELNRQLARVSERFTKLPTFTEDDFVKKDELSTLLEDLDENDAALITSEGADEEGGNRAGKRGKRSSRLRKRIDDAAEAAILNAIPTVAPPAVASASALGTTTDPTLFALSDHTHKGVDFSAAGVAGQVAFFTSDHEVRGDNALFWDNTNKRLGIGTAAPLRKLHVEEASGAGNSIESLLKQLTVDVGSHVTFGMDSPAGSGDAFMRFQISGGGETWTSGIDNSDNDNLKIGNSNVPGTNTDIDINAFGNLGIGMRGTVHVGTAPVYAGGVIGRLLVDERIGIGTTTPNGVVATSQDTAVVGTSSTAMFADLYNNTTTTGIQFVARRARGSVSVPTAIAANDQIFLFGGRAFGATVFSAGSKVAFIGSAAEAWTDAAQGTYFTIHTTVIGGTTLTERVRIADDGSVLIGTTTKVAGYLEIVSGGDLRVTGATAGTTFSSEISHTETANAASHARFFAKSGGASGGDPFLLFEIGAAVTDWAIGIDNSDSDKFKLSRSTTLGTNDVIVVTTTDLVGIGVTPSARLHVAEATLGNEVFRAESVATNDDPNYCVFQQRVETTNATVTTLQSITLTASMTYLIEARVVARRTGGAAGTAEDGAAYIITGVFKTVAGAATLIGALNVISSEDQAAWDATLDTSGTAVRVRVTGAVNNTITWHVTTLVQNVGT